MCPLQVLCLNFVCEFFITLVLFILVPFYSICVVKVHLPKTGLISEQHCKIFKYAVLLLDIKADSIEKTGSFLLMEL